MRELRDALIRKMSEAAQRYRDESFNAALGGDAARAQASALQAQAWMEAVALVRAEASRQENSNG